MAEPYGVKGCNCWADDSWSAGDPDDVVWQPNANCPHHGLLADFTGGRKDTGVYRVVTPPPAEPSAPSEPGVWTAWGEWIPDTVPGADAGAEWPGSPPRTLSAGEVGCRICGWVATGGDEIFELAVIHARTHSEDKCNRSANRRGLKNLVSRFLGRMRSRE